MHVFLIRHDGELWPAAGSDDISTNASHEKWYLAADYAITPESSPSHTREANIFYVYSATNRRALMHVRLPGRPAMTLAPA